MQVLKYQSVWSIQVNFTHTHTKSTKEPSHFTEDGNKYSEKDFIATKTFKRVSSNI